MPEVPPEPSRKTPYDVGALRDAYGDVPVYEKRFEVADASEHVAEDARGELGGAGVVISRERDDAILYVDIRSDDAAWDVPGGGRENGEAVEETAVREVHEEVGLAVELDDLACIHRVTFDDGERVQSGIWTRFAATVSDPGELDVQYEELAAATWLIERPDDVDEILEPALERLQDR